MMDDGGMDSFINGLTEGQTSKWKEGWMDEWSDAFTWDLIEVTNCVWLNSLLNPVKCYPKLYWQPASYTQNMESTCMCLPCKHIPPLLRKYPDTFGSSSDNNQMCCVFYFTWESPPRVQTSPCQVHEIHFKCTQCIWPSKWLFVLIVECC